MTIVLRQKCYTDSKTFTPFLTEIILFFFQTIHLAYSKCLFSHQYLLSPSTPPYCTTPSLPFHHFCIPPHLQNISNIVPKMSCSQKDILLPQTNSSCTSRCARDGRAIACLCEGKPLKASIDSSITISNNIELLFISSISQAGIPLSSLLQTKQQITPIHQGAPLPSSFPMTWILWIQREIKREYLTSLLGSYKTHTWMWSEKFWESSLR